MAEQTTKTAAELLGISERQVRHLVDSGELDARKVAGRLFIDETSLDRRLRSRPGPGRPLSGRAAWACLWELSGERAEWLGRSERSRLRSWLDRWSPEDVMQACRRRSARHDLRVLPRYLPDVLAAEGIAAGGLSAAATVGADIVGAGPAEIYSTDATLRELVERFGLSTHGESNLTVRIAHPPGDRLVEGRDVMPAAVVAVDLMEAADTRTRRAGVDLAAQLLDQRRYR
ncbi:MAG: helix-turn-helix domain-containing protein [Nocardioidaceae bacterium]